jgi:hypothetical protein
MKLVTWWRCSSVSIVTGYRPYRPNILYPCGAGAQGDTPPPGQNLKPGHPEHDEVLAVRRQRL